MKSKILGILLIIMIIIEGLILYNQNITLKKLNTENNKKIGEYDQTYEEKQKEKSSLEEEIKVTLSKEVFKEEEISSIIESEKVYSENIVDEISILEDKIISLEDKLSSLQKEYYKLVKENEENNTFYISNVPFINQYPDYPTGCESVALTILLNYYGINVTPADIVNRLPKGNILYTKDGKTYGGNPEIEFVGDPRTKNSFGVYEKPIAQIANQYKPGIKIATGTEFSEILKIVATGKPVMVWTSINLATAYISSSWIYEPTGETIYWKANEHAVVVIGYTDDKVIISDPVDGKMKYQSLSIFKERYNYFGKRALYY